MLQQLWSMIKAEPIRFLNGFKTFIYILISIGALSLTTDQQVLIEDTATVVLLSLAGVGFEVIISEVERSQVVPMSEIIEIPYDDDDDALLSTIAQELNLGQQDKAND